MQILSVKTKNDHSNPDECVRVCVGNREALLDSVPPWQHSFWPHTGGRGRRVRSEDREEERGKEGERGGAGYVCKAGCESPQGEGRRGEDSSVEGESVSVIDIPSCLG